MIFTQFHIETGRSSKDTVVSLDGVDISSLIDRIVLEVDVDDIPRVSVRYVCDGATIEGQAVIEHVCPLGGLGLKP